MKQKLLLFFTAIFSITHAQLNNGLKAHYSFDGNTNDTSGKNHHGKIMGEVNLVADRFQIPNSAYQFPGNATSYIAVDYAEDFNITPTGTFSISLWYKGGSDYGADFEVIIGKENPQVGPKRYDYFLGLYDGNRLLSGGNGNEALWSPITPPRPDLNWHHAVIVYENKKWYIYQNNTLTITSTNRIVEISQSTNGLVIGKDFEGIVDDVRFYNRKLTNAEIDELYNLPSLSTIENRGVFDVSISPNPTSKTVNIIRENNDLVNVFMYDLTGKQVYNKHFFQKEISIDLSNFATGSYLLKMISNQSEKSKLIIKK